MTILTLSSIDGGIFISFVGFKIILTAAVPIAGISQAKINIELMKLTMPQSYYIDKCSDYFYETENAIIGKIRYPVNKPATIIIHFNLIV